MIKNRGLDDILTCLWPQPCSRPSGNSRWPPGSDYLAYRKQKQQVCMEFDFLSLSLLQTIQVILILKNKTWMMQSVG